MDKPRRRYVMDVRTQGPFVVKIGSGCHRQSREDTGRATRDDLRGVPHDGARLVRTMTADEFCLSRHDGTVSPYPPRHERTGRTGRRCMSCHPPERGPTGEVSIHDRRYIPAEAVAKNDFIPPPDFRSICYGCHPIPSRPRKGA